MEVYVLVPKKKNFLVQLSEIVSWVIGVVTFVLTAIGFFAFFPIAVAGIMLGAFLHTRNFEYEYAYFDGDVRFAKIINKSRRKNLRGYGMEDVLVIAPIEDRSVYQYLHNSSNKIKDYTSGNADAKVYVLVAKVPEGLEVVKYEPDEKYLDSVCVKYRQKVVR